MSDKIALVTGVTGQDGSYLAEFLLSQGYHVYGMVRRRSSQEMSNLVNVLGDRRFHIVGGDLTDANSLHAVIDESRPHEIYNLGAMSFVANSWREPMLTNDVNYMGFMRLLLATAAYAERTGIVPRIFQASSSEMYGNQPAPQDEKSQMIPRSPYGVSKLAAHRIARVHRESYGMFISCGISFNHESPRRGMEFVTRKIAHGVAQIVAKRTQRLDLGDLSPQRDWGFVGDYVRAFWLMLQQDEADDYVIATGETNSVEDFVRLAFEHAGLRWSDHVHTCDDFLRPAEIFALRGDASKAKRVLGWEPTVDLHELIGRMVDAEMGRLDGKQGR